MAGANENKNLGAAPISKLQVNNMCNQEKDVKIHFETKLEGKSTSPSVNISNVYLTCFFWKRFQFKIMHVLTDLSRKISMFEELGLHGELVDPSGLAEGDY